MWRTWSKNGILGVQMLRKIEISHRTIIFTVLFLMLLWFLYLVRDVILQVFVALLIAIILNPLVTKLSKYKVPRGISAIVIYLILIGILGVSLSGLVPAVIDQTTAFVGILPSYISNFQLPFGLNQTFAQELSAQLGKLPQQIGGFVVSIFSNTLTILSTLIVSLYLVIEWATLENELEHFFGESKANSLKTILRELENRLGGWARGELILMFIVGLSVYVGLLLIGVPYALPLAILAGFLELIPMLGPIVAAVPAVIVGFSVSPWSGVAVAALAFLVQQVENYVFVPNIMKKSVGLSPVVTLLSIIIGFKLAGISGAILSVPVVISIESLLQARLKSQK